MLKTCSFFLFYILTFQLIAQPYTQTVRGRVIDKQSQMPLIGATVILVESDPVKGATTDLDGYFILTGVPVGRQSFNVSFIGYGSVYSVKEWIGMKGQYTRLVKDRGTSYTLQAYAQWQYRLTQTIELNPGIHAMYFGLNGQYALEPRASLKWQFLPAQSISYGFGLHSRVEALSIYLVEVPLYNQDSLVNNDNLGFTKSLHHVLGYDWMINTNLRVKVETYYQYLYHVAQPSDPQSKQSGVNFLNGLVDVPLNNSGNAYNYGIELTLEKFFSKNYYYLLTTSLFNSKYIAPDGNTYNTLFNGNYIINTLAGKEYVFKKSSLALNSKLIIKGSNRTTPLDMEQTLLQNKAVYQEDKFLEDNQIKNCYFNELLNV